MACIDVLVHVLYVSHHATCFATITLEVVDTIHSRFNWPSHGIVFDSEFVVQLGSREQISCKFTVLLIMSNFVRYSDWNECNGSRLAYILLAGLLYSPSLTCTNASIYSRRPV